MPKRYGKHTLLCFLAASLFLCACSNNPVEKKLFPINIAFQEWVGYGPFYLAQEKGFLKDEGIELDFIDEQLDSARREAFVSRILDCEAGTVDLLVSKRAQDVPVTAVMELDYSFGADGIITANSIKELKNLVGKRVTFARDDVGETFISYLFYKAGLSMDDITIVSRYPENVSDAFLNNEADAVVTWEPWLSKALKRPQSHILVTSKDVPGAIIDTLNVREDIIKNHPEKVKGLMRAWFKALKYYKENPSQACSIMSKYYNMSARDYQKALAGLQWIDYAQQKGFAKAAELKELFKIISEIKLKNNRISNSPDVSKAINYDLLEQLYENSQ